MRYIQRLLPTAGALLLCAAAHATGPDSTGSTPINLVIQSWVSVHPLSPATITITNGGTTGSVSVPFTFDSNNTGSISAKVVSNVAATHPNWLFTVSGLTPTSFTPGGPQLGSFKVAIAGVKLTDQANTYSNVATATVTITNAS
jgi:hypothetical protein